MLARHHDRTGSLEATLQRLGTIQFDPLSPLGTNPDLVLQSRVHDYRQGDWQDAAYRRRLLVDGWDKQASLIPPDHWWAQSPFHHWFARRWLRRGVDVESSEAEDILQQVARCGPSTSLELGDQRSDPDLKGSWYGPKRSRHLLKALWDAGRLMTHHRQNGRHAYDLPERVLPQGSRVAEADTDAALEHLIVRRVRAAGMLRPAADAAVWLLPCRRDERDSIAARALDKGRLVELDVEGERYWASPEAVASLDDLRVAEASRHRMRFLAPLDPLMWDRRAISRIFGFEYIWEVYKPRAQRRWGYYVLPVRWGERFVGRFDARCRKGILTIHAWHWEDDITPSRLPDGMPDALHNAARDFLDYLGAQQVILPRGLGREARRAWQKAVR
ncbi:DNA glycosylase AlkZ-like family protein [Halomonas borealis]|uniref:DNA glycosylase AlkZ-like family protein n=1 Tax=Halomonas borealis TaxID=2508710 RepID=UPI0014451205|nr:crosslink repair DNA glycosylase YcaQ family protein [Halomonas borealis]